MKEKKSRYEKANSGKMRINKLITWLTHIGCYCVNNMAVVGTVESQCNHLML